MTALSTPRHPLVDLALRDARTWCAGHVIDDRPALVHAVRVAVALARYVPNAAPDLVCAALLHDSPDFAPPGLDLDAVLTRRYGPQTARVVRAMEREHAALDRGDPPIAVDDGPVLLVSTADKIVALSSLLHRARRSGDVHDFFSSRPALLSLLPYFRAFHDAAADQIPSRMTGRLTTVLVALDRATAASREAWQRRDRVDANRSTSHLRGR